MFVCSVGSLFGDLTQACWLAFGIAAWLVFSIIYLYRLGMLLSILMYALTNNAVIYLTLWHEHNSVSEIGLAMEFGASVFGFLFAYSLGVKHFFEDAAW